MSNTYGAHIFKQRQVGQREEVKIKLFLPNGDPLNLSGDAPPSEPEPVMLFRGEWNPASDYRQYDVVLYDPGDGVHSYIFDEHVNSGTPVMLDSDGNQIMKFWDPNVNQIDLVLGPDSRVGNAGYVPGPYDVFAIKVNEAGYLSLRAADTLGQSQDLGAYLRHLKPDGTWDVVTGDDDGSAFGKPWIRYAIPGTHIMPGIYSYYLSRYSAGIAIPTAYGTTRITPAVDNTAVIGSFADFPADKTIRIG